MDPVADPRSVVTAGHVRFTVLTPELVRMEWSAAGRFEDHASLVFLNRRLPVPGFSVERHEQGVSIETQSLRLDYHPSTKDEKLSASNLTIRFTLNGREITWRPGTADTGNLSGTTRTLDNSDGTTTIPLDPGLISRNGWVVVDDSTRPLFDSADFSFREGERSPWPWVIQRPPGDRQDWYFFGYGHEYKRALGDFVKVAGRIPLPPRFAFGSWWSRYWAYSDRELEDLVREFKENNVPLDVLVVDMEWHNTLGMHYDRKDASGNRLGWTGYTWNRLLFPSPKDFLDDMHRQGLKVTLNLHPASGVQPWEEKYAQMAQAMGIDPSSKKYVPFDITNKTYAQNYFDILHHPLEKQGVDFWWLDWQQGDETGIPGLNPTWWLNYVHFTDQQREGKRPLLFHRWGGLGNHRYQIGFSGDTVSTWDSLHFQPGFTATAANVGYAYWSHDIGGHIPGKVDPELYTRWVQFGVFSPILRTHTTKNPEAERRIWAYPEPYSKIMREAFQLRYALEPYLYTEARKTYDSGVAFMRPLYYDWPEQAEAYRHSNEYMFGDSMLAAPVTAPAEPSTGLAVESLWIPPGDWIEWQTGTRVRGPQLIERKASIEQVPVYLREGAIIPMQAEMLYMAQRPVDPLILNVFPARNSQTMSYRLYEDSSAGEQYQHGVCAWTGIDTRHSDGTTVIRIHPVQGDYPGMPQSRAYIIRLNGDLPPDLVTVNGVPARFHPLNEGGSLRWRYDGNSLTTEIDVPRTSVRRHVTIIIKRRTSTPRLEDTLNGFAGSIARLRAAYDTLNVLWPRTWSPDPLIEALQTGDRITLTPHQARSELKRFPQLYLQAVASTRRLFSDTRLNEEAQHSDSLSQSIQDPANAHRAPSSSLLAKAMALLEDGEAPAQSTHTAELPAEAH